MAKVKFFKINNSELSSLPIVEGQLIFVQDEGKVYIDKDDSNRVLIDGSNLTGYVKNTDYASSSIGGVIKTASSKATSVSSGVLQADTKTYSDYTSGGNDMFIGKGTLENVLTGKGYTTNTGTITGVSVNGTSVATSGVANITSIPASILSGAIPSGVTATTQSQGDSSTKVATTAYVDTAISNLPEPMIFKGSLGTGGTITTLPSASSSNEGWTYKVITDGTYASQSAKVGDTFISDGSAWILIPSGDEPSGTVTSVKIAATSPIAVDSDSAITTSGTRTISHANSGVTAGTYRSVTVNATGHVTAGSNPTTISGYGITDASISDQTVTLGSNSVTVPTKTSELNNDANFMSGMTILKYGSSTWQDFITAYTNKHVVYCRASSNANPASGSQTRMAFMAYVSDETNPTNVEFQYYRSVSSHSDSQQGDQTYVYKLTNANGGTWSVTVRENYTKVVAGTALSSTWASGKITLNHATSGVTAGTYKSVTVDAQGHVTAGSNPTTLSGYGITDANISSGVITLGSDTITPLTSSSTLDATKLSGTIPSECYTDTKNTTGSTNSSDKIYLVGATSQAANPQTYSNTKLYYNNGLYSQATAGQGNTMCTINQSSSGITLEYDNGYSDHKIVMGSTGISLEGVKTPTNNTDAANKQYVDDNIPTIDTNISTGSTSTGVPTSQAVASFVEGKGYLTSEVNSNLLNGSTTGSLRGIGTTTEDSSYTMGQYAFAEGYTTKASGDYSHAEGRGTTASNEYAHAEGRSSIASGKYGHAEGYYTTASSFASHAEGSGTIASGQKSHAEGEYTTAASNHQHVQGKYNIIDSNNIYVDIVGNGTAENARSNAYTLDWSGNGTFAGDVYVNGSNKVLGSGHVSATVSSPNQTYYLTGVTDTTTSDDSQLYNTRMSSRYTGVKYQTSTSIDGGTLTVDDRPVTLGLYYDIS